MEKFDPDAYLAGQGSDEFNPDEYLKIQPKAQTSVYEDVKLGVANLQNTMERAAQLITAPGLAAYSKLRGVDPEETFRLLKEGREARIQKAGGGKEQSFGGKAISMLPSIPAFPLLLAGSPLDTAAQFIEEGESVPRALAAGGIDLAGNMLGLKLDPVGGSIRKRLIANAGIQAGQDTATRAAIEQIAQNQPTKEMFAPSMETAGLAGILGGGMSLLYKGKQVGDLTPEQRMREAAARKRAEEVKKTPDVIPEQKLPEVFTATPEGVVYPKDAQTDLYRQKAMEKVVGELDQTFEQDQKARPMGPEDQMGLPWSTGVEEIAARKNAADPTGQMDMFVEAARKPDVFNELMRKDAIDEPNMELARQEQAQARQQQMEEMFQQRAAEQEQARRLEEQLKQEDMFAPLQEQLSQERVSKGQQKKMNRGMAGRQRGGIDFSFGKKRDEQLLKEENAESREMMQWANNARIGATANQMADLTKTYSENAILISKASRLYNDLAVGLSRSDLDVGRTVRSLEESYKNMLGAGEALAKGDTDTFERLSSNAQYHLREAGDYKKTLNTYIEEVIQDRKDFSRKRSSAAKEMVAAIDSILGPSSVVTPSFKKRQQGGIDFSFLEPLFGDKKKKFVEDILQTKMQPDDVDGDIVVAAALSEGKDARGLSYVESGGTLAAMKRNSAAVLGASRLAQQASNAGDLNIRNNVMPVERSLRKLSRQELSSLMNLFKEETSLERRFTPQELADFGYDVKTLAAYNDLRTMFTKALEAENEARVALGKKPITELEYYSSHRWQGNFRQDFLDADGKHVWSLAGNSKWDLARQRNALLKEFPELQPSKERIIRQGKDVASPAELYKHMLDILGEDDPSVARIKEWYEKQGVTDPTAEMLAQEKHFKKRAGIRGYVGDRPANTGKWFSEEGSYDVHKEAMDFFQEQITYAKNGFKWAEMQKAGKEIKKIISDPELNKQQPNNIKFIRDYWKQNLGVSEAKFISQMEDSWHDWGVSPREVRKYVGDLKSAWIGQKLLASAGFVVSNLVQSTAVLPHMMDIMVKTGGNPLVGLAHGMSAAISIPTFHYASFLPDKTGQSLRRIDLMASSPFMAAAMKYAEDNGVVSRSTYDESPIEASFSAPRRAAELAAKATISAPETIIRSFAFMSYAAQLKSSGKYTNDMDIFRLAEERTNASMVDMRAGERPIVFNKLGMFGDLAGALQSFPMNFYNQWSWAAREASKGNVLPALTMATVQYTLAGFMGLPGFQDMDKFMEMVKTWASKNDPKLWNTIKDWNPKRLVMDNLGEDALYGKLSTETGVALTSRVAAPSFSDMALAGGNIVGDVGKQLGNVASLAYSPSEKKFAKTAIESAPVGVQGLLETTAFRDVLSKPVEGGRLYSKRSEPVGDYTRTPDDEFWRKWGLRTQQEALTKDERWQADARSIQGRKAATEALDKFYIHAKNGDKEEAASYARLYTQLTGNPISSQLLENRFIKEYTDAVTRGKMNAKNNLEAIKAMKRMEDIVNQSKSP